MQRFRILALGGGGTKGFLEVGALELLEERVGPLHEHFTEGVYGCSIGSILGTAVAFGVPVIKVRELFKQFPVSELFKLDMNIGDIIAKKGIFSMDYLESKLISAFNSIQIPIEKKNIGDALVPLRIQASNISKGIPTIFQKNVPVVKAILASSCIPFVFRPQQINDSLYVDGGFLTNLLMTTIPEADHEKTLCFSIIHSDPHITPAKLKTMNPVDYAYKMYKTSCLYERKKTPIKNNLDLFYDKGNGLTSWTTVEQDEMILVGRTLTQNFLTERGY
uniref:PNPLA domain-containing protein n=1 Tax=viral metagenome TaxID=1070528 RepID=A0A6C0HF47_9ZZZZ